MAGGKLMFKTTIKTVCKSKSKLTSVYVWEGTCGALPPRIVYTSHPVTQRDDDSLAIAAIKSRDEAITAINNRDEAITAIKSRDEAVTAINNRDEAITAIKSRDEAVTATKSRDEAVTASFLLPASEYRMTVTWSLKNITHLL